MIVIRPPFQRRRGGEWFAQAKLGTFGVAGAVTLHDLEWERPFDSPRAAEQYVQYWAASVGLEVRRSA